MAFHAPGHVPAGCDSGSKQAEGRRAGTLWRPLATHDACCDPGKQPPRPGPAQKGRFSKDVEGPAGQGQGFA